MKCINCEFINPAVNRFCGRCGSLISEICPDCGKANPLDYDYCGHCGSLLGSTPNFYERKEPSATYSYFPASRSAFTVKSSTNEQEVPDVHNMLAGERRVATVIVADVKKSMDLLSKMGSEAWVELMSKLLQVMEAQIYRFGGKVDQFRGDGLVAFFGARDAHEDDPERAVLAALAMQEGFEQYKREFEPVESQDLKLRIGINTDELIVAQVGTKGLHRENTAMGEAIALAARLEAEAEPGTILVSDITYNLVAEKFHWIDLGNINIKGIVEPVHVYRPLALRSDAELLKEMQTYIHSSPLIGRYAEYDLMQKKVENLMGGRGEIVLITGERGLGKSFLVRQVHKDLALRKQVQDYYEMGQQFDPENEEKDTKKVLWLRGWCNSYEQLSPLFMWRILLKSWLGLDPEETDIDVLERLITFCKDLWPDRNQEFIPILASVLSLENEEIESELATLDAQGYQGKLIHTIREWLKTLSARLPLILSFGSVQWANAGSIDLLRELISLTEDHPILWFIAYRPDRLSPMWHFQQYLETEFPHRLTLVPLVPFSDEESKALIEYILQPFALDRETMNIIVSRTEGNPYFIRELVNSLVNDDILIKDEQNHVWRLTSNITTSDLPESLHSLFLARIDKLTKSDRLILQIASVTGFVFWRAVIAEIVPDEVNLTESLNNLQKADFIEERGSFIDLGVAYNFSSTLIKDVTYESILISQRKKLHAEIGEFLQSFEFNQEISPNLLAYHFQMAGNLQLELLYRIQAADQSRNIFANQEAYQEYTRALEILDELEKSSADGSSFAILTQRFELVKGRIEILYHLGRVSDAHQESQRLLTIADQIEDDPVWRVDALLIQPGVKYVQNQEALQTGIPQAEEALRLSREISDPYREMQSLAAVAGHKFLQNDPDWYDFGQKAIAIAEELDDKKTQVQLLLGLAGAYGMDKLEIGLELVKKARPIAEEINFKGAQVEMLYWMGTEFERAGDYYTLLKDYEERRLQLSRELGWRLVEARSLMFVGQIKGLYLGDYLNALPHLEKGAKLWQDTDQRLFVYLRQAQVNANIKKYETAKHYLSLAEPLSVRFVQTLALVGYELVNAILHLNIGTLDSLMRVLENAKTVLQMAEEENLVSRQYRMAAACKAAQAQLRIAGIMRESNDMGGYEHYKKKALDSSGLALDTYNEFGFTQIVETVSEEILYYHGLALKENGKFDEGETYLQKAHGEVMRKFKMIPVESHYQKTFMRIKLHQLILDENKKYD
jgi:class 3 adenylate cyclase